MAAPVIQAVRGMNDILPSESALWQRVETMMRKALRSHGYAEIRFPIVEKTELFKRSIGEVTDIVEKEMYTFIDRNDDSLTLRPEGTACCVRAGLEHGLLYNQIQRLWYAGPFYRHERPQKGRYRQFHQCSAEVFGLPGPDIDAELIALSAFIFEKLGINELITLEINSLGTSASRARYREALVTYFNDHHAQLDEDSVNRLHRNPLRILDSKNPEMKSLLQKAPKLLDYLDQESKDHFDGLQDILQQVHIPFEINPTLVRGLDYYTKTVFEWTTKALGAQGTICAGGRYDTLVEQLGGKPTPAIGFSIGMERTILLLTQHEKLSCETAPHVYVMVEDPAAFAEGLKLANYLRSKVPTIRLVMHCGGGPLKNQLKKADKLGAQYGLILGEHELKTRTVLFKSLREKLPQQSLYRDELAEYLKLKLSKK